MNQYQEYMGTDELTIVPAETQLREDLADAMRESPRDSGKSKINDFLSFNGLHCIFLVNFLLDPTWTERDKERVFFFAKM